MNDADLRARMLACAPPMLPLDADVSDRVDALAEAARPKTTPRPLRRRESDDA